MKIPTKFQQAYCIVNTVEGNSVLIRGPTQGTLLTEYEVRNITKFSLTRTTIKS